jgi:hypothetical protein
MAQRVAPDQYRFHVAEDGTVLVGGVAMLGSGHHHRKGLARRLWDLARDEAARSRI